MSKPAPGDNTEIACEVCLAEIPASVAHSLEGPDYVHHFCGLDCYARWKDTPESAAETATPKPR